MLILNQTVDGRRFRPSDWVERICSLYASFDSDRRLQYSTNIKPVCDVYGNCCLFVHEDLKTYDPNVYNFIYTFALVNNLVITDVEKEKEEKSSS